MASLFISDLHLCPSRPQINRLFLDFLAGPARQADTLYILGDLFEYWAGDDDLDDPFNAEICAGLRILSKSGVPLFFMAGNRDFLAGDGFASKAGLTLLPVPLVLRVREAERPVERAFDWQAFSAFKRGPVIALAAGGWWWRSRR